MGITSVINEAVQYIRHAYAEPLTVADIAGRAYWSSPHFAVLFRTATGYPVKNYINRYRLYRAAVDLHNGNSSLAEVAYAHGFSSQQAFTRSFSKTLGITPAKFRRSGLHPESLFPGNFFPENISHPEGNFIPENSPHSERNFSPEIFSHPEGNFSPEHFPHPERSKIMQTIDELTRQITADPTNAALYDERAGAYQKAGEYGKMMVDAQKALDLEPDNPEYLGSYGHGLGWLKRYDESLIYLTRALEKAAGRTDVQADIYEGMGNTYQQMNKIIIENGDAKNLEGFEKSVEYHTKALEINPDNAWVLYCRSISYRWLGEWEKAYDDMVKALTLTPDNKEYLHSIVLSISDCLNTYTDDEPWATRREEALPYLSQAVENKVDEALANFCMGIIYHCTGMKKDRDGDTENLDNFHKSMEYFTKAIKLEPNNAESLFRRGIVYTWLNKYEEAFADFAKAYTLDPDNKEYLCAFLSFAKEITVRWNTRSGEIKFKQDIMEETVRPNFGDNSDGWPVPAILADDESMKPYEVSFSAGGTVFLHMDSDADNFRKDIAAKVNYIGKILSGEEMASDEPTTQR